jgi:hypothetical protein
VKDGHGQKVAYIDYQEEAGRRSSAKLLIVAPDRGEYRQVAGAIEKPQSEATALVGQGGHSMSALKATSAAMVRAGIRLG